MSNFRNQNEYQNCCEVVKFNHPLVTGEDALSIVPRLPDCYRHVINASSSVVDHRHPYTNICTAAKSSLLKSTMAFDHQRRTCMAYYDAILIATHHSRSTIIVLEGEQAKVNDEECLGVTLLRTMTMWEGMIHMMNMLEPNIIIGDMLQLQCNIKNDKVRFYGIWIINPDKRIRGDIQEICINCGMNKVKHEILRYHGGSTPNIMMNHILALFHSLLRKYNNKSYDRDRTIHELSLNDIAVVDHDRCLVRCYIPITR